MSEECKWWILSIFSCCAADVGLTKGFTIDSLMIGRVCSLIIIQSS